MFHLICSIERWKYNPEYELYISNKGHFKTREKKDCHIYIGQNGYCYIYAYGTVHRKIACHRAVMLTWRPTVNAENLTVDHLNHNKRDNSLNNLEWVTIEENSIRAKNDLIVEEKDNEVSEEDNKVSEDKESNDVEEKPIDTCPFYIEGVKFSYEQLVAILKSAKKLNKQFGFEGYKKKLKNKKVGDTFTMIGVEVTKGNKR